MINLLPPDVKQNYHYARRNNRLVQWVVILGAGFAGLTLLGGAGVFYLRQTASNYDQQVASIQASLQNQQQAKTEQQVKAISDNLKLAVQVLSKQVLYSQMLKQLATIIPTNVTLSNLTISQGQNALDITANTKDYNAATQLQVNLADPTNKIFSKADIISISCSSSGTSNKTYPCSVTIRALFNSKNPYLFAASTSGSSKK